MMLMAENDELLRSNNRGEQGLVLPAATSRRSSSHRQERQHEMMLRGGTRGRRGRRRQHHHHPAITFASYPRWDELLKKRPKDDRDTKAMAGWLMEVMTVSEMALREEISPVPSARQQQQQASA